MIKNSYLNAVTVKMSQLALPEQYVPVGDAVFVIMNESKFTPLYMYSMEDQIQNIFAGSKDVSTVYCYYKCGRILLFDRGISFRITNPLTRAAEQSPSGPNQFDASRLELPEITTAMCLPTLASGAIMRIIRERQAAMLGMSPGSLAPNNIDPFETATTYSPPVNVRLK